MAVSYKIIGRHIRAARKACNLTQEQVAEAMKFSVAHYGRLERGEREINMERLSQLSVLLNVPIEHLVEGCVADAPAVLSETLQEDPFLNQMAQYAQFCREDTLQRMLKVQSFPDNFFFEGPRTAAFVQIGNAVPPLLAKAIAKAIKQEFMERANRQ